MKQSKARKIRRKKSLEAGFNAQSVCRKLYLLNYSISDCVLRLFRRNEVKAEGMGAAMSIGTVAGPSDASQNGRKEEISDCMASGNEGTKVQERRWKCEERRHLILQQKRRGAPLWPSLYKIHLSVDGVQA